MRSVTSGATGITARVAARRMSAAFCEVRKSASVLEPEPMTNAGSSPFKMVSTAPEVSSAPPKMLAAPGILGAGDAAELGDAGLDAEEQAALDVEDAARDGRGLLLHVDRQHHD